MYILFRDSISTTKYGSMGKTGTRLQYLGLARTRVTDQQHVDITAVPRPSTSPTPRDILVSPSKELEENPLLDVVHGPHARRQRTRQDGVNVRMLRELLDLLLHVGLAHDLTLLLVLLLLAHAAADARHAIAPREPGRLVEAEAVVLAETDVDDVEERLEEALDRPTPRVHAHRHAAEDPRHDEPVARLAHVHQLVVRAQRDRVRRLPVRDRVRRLLQPDHLAVRELAAVVHERHRADGRADVARARRWLVDLAAVDFDLHGVVAGEAAEEGDFHVGNDGSRPDDQTLDTNEFVGVLKAAASQFLRTQIGVMSLYLAG